jgi:hypothetical protein
MVVFYGSAMVQSYLHDRAEFVGLLDVQLQTHISLVVLSLIEEAGRGPSLELGPVLSVTMPGRGATERRQEVGIGGDAQDVRLGGGPPDNSRAGPTHNALRLKSGA